jgi:hypothetical protein
MLLAIGFAAGASTRHARQGPYKGCTAPDRVLRCAPRSLRPPPGAAELRGEHWEVESAEEVFYDARSRASSLHLDLDDLQEFLVPRQLTARPAWVPDEPLRFAPAGGAQAPPLVLFSLGAGARVSMGRRRL